MSNINQKFRLAKIITEQYKEVDGYIENDLLHVDNQCISLTPLLNLFKRIQNSKEFTRLPPLFDKTENFPISDMYIELAVAKSSETADPLRLIRGLSLAEEQEERHKHQRTRHIDLQQCVNNPQHHNMVILGDPGSGKTSLLKHLCLSIAKGTNKRWVLPIFIPLNQYWQEKERKPSLTLLHYAAAFLVAQKDMKNVSPNFSMLMREEDVSYGENIKNIKEIEEVLIKLSSPERRHILFLLDGLDEIASNSNAINSVSHDIQQLAGKFSWVLTSRYTGFYSEFESDIRYEVVSLHNEAIQELVTNWFKYTLHPNHDEKAKLILDQILDNPRLLDMARNPFLLTLLCHVQNYNTHDILPVQRNDIYSEIVKLIRKQLRTKDKKNKNLLGDIELDYLAKFCHYLYTQVKNAPLQLFEEDHWRNCAYPDSPPDLKKHFLSSRLIKPWKIEGDYHFVHLTFQEYFIAKHLSSLKFEDIKYHLYNPQWRIVYRFLAGIYGKQQDKTNYFSLIKLILNPVDKTGLLYIEAAKLLTEADFEDSTPIIGYDIRDKLWETWCKDKSYIKNGAADALAQLSPKYVIKRYLKTIENEDKEYIVKKSIILLGYTNLKEADELLLKLYQDSSNNYMNEVIKALALKNTPYTRTKVIDLYLQNKEKMFLYFCNFSKEAKNKDLLVYLNTYLVNKPKNLSHYSPLFEALKAIGSADIAQSLMTFIEKYQQEELSIELISCFLSLDSDIVNKWVTESLSITTNDTLLLTACEYGKIPDKAFIKLLQVDDLLSQKKYISAIRTQSMNGIQPSKLIIECLLEIMLSDTKNNEIAFDALLEVNPKNITYGSIPQELIQKYRSFIYSKEEYISSSAITILAQSVDIQSFETILKLAISEKSNLSVKIESIRALAYYYKLETDVVINTLHSIYQREKIEADRYFAEAALVTLAKVNIREISEYLEDTFNHDSLSTISSEENIILFEDSYIDKFGKQHNWLNKDAHPKLDPNNSGYEQQDELRAICQYLLTNKFAKKSGRLYQGAIPLFYKDTPTNEHFKSITYNTGIKFLKGKNIRSDRAQDLMNWVALKFPNFLETPT